MTHVIQDSADAAFRYARNDPPPSSGGKGAGRYGPGYSGSGLRCGNGNHQRSGRGRENCDETCRVREGSDEEMKFIGLVLVCLLAMLPCVAQPAIGLVEVYGTRKLSKEKILATLGVKAGSALPKSKGDAEEKLEGIAGVLRSRLEVFCCDQGKMVLYVGIEERGATAFQYRSIAEEAITLPEEILQAYADFSAALARASAEGDLKEDLSAGHSIMQNLPCRVAQERFVGLAELHLEKIRNVLKSAEDPDQRAIAAYVAGYAPRKDEIAPDLQLAMQDPDGGVRTNAARALKAIGYLSLKKKDPAFRVQPTWFVEMLNSVQLSDRLEATKALLLFTEEPNPLAITNIQERAVPALVEMARWQYLPHALPAYLLLGRVAGWKEADLESSWAAGEREKTIKSLEKALLTKK